MNISSLHIDNLSFAKKAERVEGKLDIAACSRLLEILQSHMPKKHEGAIQASSVVHFMLQGEMDAQGRSFILAHIDAQISTYCQRCLEPLSLPFKLSFRYLVAEAESQNEGDLALDDSDEYDLQDPDKAMDIVALIEDELIMAFPVSPAHDYDCANLVTQSGDKQNPFAILKGLIKS